MGYRINEGKENSILSLNITVKDFSYLINEDYTSLIIKMINEDQLLRLVKFPKHIINLILDVIINDKDVNYLKEELTINKLPLFSLIINLVNNYKRKYQKLLELKENEEITIECNKDNFIKGLELAKKLNKKVLIEGDNISLSDYQKLLSNYDIDSLNGFDIKVYYQEQNHEISVKELYETSIVIEDISKEIKKYNLSPLEKVIYVYDKVKSRVYTKSNEDERESRDLNRVLNGNFIVCMGFSNIFNAVLRSLGINAIPLISLSKNHQCSLAYIQDNKYNINGVYVFDPTNDSRRNNEYIDNYNYFGMTLASTENIFPSEIYKLANMSFNDILEIQENISFEGCKKSISIDTKMKKLFELIKEYNYEEFVETLRYFEFTSPEVKDGTIDSYRTFKIKYNPQEISLSKFMLALCNTRLIEYYNGIIDEFNIEDIKEAAKERSFYQRSTSLKNETDVKRMMKLLDYSIKLDDTLDTLTSQINTDIEKRKLNLRLLKVLRNKQK